MWLFLVADGFLLVHPGSQARMSLPFPSFVSSAQGKGESVEGNKGDFMVQAWKGRVKITSSGHIPMAGIWPHNPT